jgi:oligoribonuclease NrnB/cAMP/cGMP phosphodiesterase (DHH superfamily)
MKYVIYHAHCPDGFMAAYIANRYFRGQDVQYIPMNYQQPIPEFAPDDELFVLDFSFKRDMMQKLMDQGVSVVVLDHHKTAEEELTPFICDQVIFDAEECGATLAWKYFFPNQEMPRLIEYVKDRDLWQWKLPYSREVSSALWSEDQTFDHYDDLISYDLYYFRTAGEAILKYQKRLIEQICSQSVVTNFLGFVVPIVNSLSLQSEVCERLLAMHPESLFSATYYTDPNGDTKVSLRSRGDFDVSVLAKQYGGGGHRAAAGFKTNKSLHEII